jgi:hypothetical protein
MVLPAVLHKQHRENKPADDSNPYCKEVFGSTDTRDDAGSQCIAHEAALWSIAVPCKLNECGVPFVCLCVSVRD